MNKAKIKKAATITGAALGLAFIVMRKIAKHQMVNDKYRNDPSEQNPMYKKRVVFIEDDNDPVNADGKRGHLEAVGTSHHIPTFYEKYIKRGFDIVLSFGGMVVLAPVYAVTAIAIKVDSPGSVIFKQKRISQHKGFFTLPKFRSMAKSSDVPTHMLQESSVQSNITAVGRVIRKLSIDELPQCWSIFKGDMSIIGPRPALWNQDYLTAERDKYGANDVKPGLTGLAQISGRDELEIPEKAKLDGVYAQAFQAKGNSKLRDNLVPLIMDCKIFFRSIVSVFRHDGIVEGGTGMIDKRHEMTKPLNDTIAQFDGNYPLVSVIIATYKRSESLKRAILSITEQSYHNVEIIIIDDNADEKWNDYVAEIIEKCKAMTDKCIIYLKNEHNMGSAMTRNRGIEKASGDYITFLDDDDVYLTKKIEQQVSYMIKADADYSITDLELFDDHGRSIDYRSREYIQDYSQKSLMKYHLMYHLTGTDTLMFKSSYLRKIGGFPAIDVGDEFYLMQEAILGGGRLIYIKQCNVKAIVHQGNDNGLSSGESKIRGEHQLYATKQKYFYMLTSKEKKYVTVRHHAVLAFAYKRAGKHLDFIKEATQAFITSPQACISILRNR